MKSLLLIISLFSNLSLAANKQIEPGLYSAVDAETQTIVSSLLMGADNSVVFNIRTAEFTMPEPGCVGIYNVAENKLSADMQCPLDFLSSVQVTIDVTNVTPESVRSEQGVIVDVVIDALGSDAYKFILKKVK